MPSTPERPETRNSSEAVGILFKVINMEIKNRKFITIERVKSLHESINWLDDYETIDGEIHHIGANINTMDVNYTKLLNELGNINIRKKEIIKLLTK